MKLRKKIALIKKQFKKLILFQIGSNKKRSSKC